MHLAIVALEFLGVDDELLVDVVVGDGVQALELVERDDVGHPIFVDLSPPSTSTMFVTVSGFAFWWKVKHVSRFAYHLFNLLELDLLFLLPLSSMQMPSFAEVVSEVSMVLEVSIGCPMQGRAFACPSLVMGLKLIGC